MAGKGLRKILNIVFSKDNQLRLSLSLLIILRIRVNKKKSKKKKKKEFKRFWIIFQKRCQKYLFRMLVNI